MSRPQLSPDKAFGLRVSRLARQQCERILGTAAGQQAAQRITMAILGAMQAARDPSAFHNVTDLSLANCIALSAQTGLLPGGTNTQVYLVPQAARRGEPPELQWRITHRGLAVLAYRGGFALRAVPIHAEDHLVVSLGEITEHSGSPDAWPEGLDELRGIAVVIRDLERGQDVIRAWVPMVVIDRRRKTSRTDAVWRHWPIEMAQKTAIKYVFARGSAPIDSPELSSALEADSRGEVVDVQPTATPTATQSTSGADILRTTPRAIPEAVPAEDLAAQAEESIRRSREARQTAPEPAQEVEPRQDVGSQQAAPQEQPEDRQAIKREIADLERELGKLTGDGDRASQIRERRGISLTQPVSGSKLGLDNLRAWREELSLAVEIGGPGADEDEEQMP